MEPNEDLLALFQPGDVDERTIRGYAGVDEGRGAFK